VAGAAQVGTADRAEGYADPAAPVAVGRSLTDEVKRLTVVFDAALARRDAETATAAALELESSLHAWSADTFQSDEVDRARAALRRMMLRLGELAAPGVRDPRDVAAPWVEALLAEGPRHARLVALRTPTASATSCGPGRGGARLPVRHGLGSPARSRRLGPSRRPA